MQVRDVIKPGEKIRVLVVDDSVVMRRMISRMIEQDTSFELVGAARHGVDALAKIPQLKPHVVTLDVEMPELDGIGTLRRIVELHPGLRVVMLSSLTAKGSQTAIEALMLGSSDYVTKPHSEVQGNAFENLAAELTGKIKQLFPFVAPNAVKSARPRLVVSPAPGIQRPEIFAIGVSTGGPAALTEILPTVPENFSLPIVIVQHMPPDFTGRLAERLNKISSIRVLEAKEGMRAEPGCALIAPGDFHMRLARVGGHELVVRLDREPQENSCRPAVDVLLRSIAECCKGRAIAAILTGMGQDGLLGAMALKTLGATILAQDYASSVVWGMPGAIVAANLADAVLPLNGIVPEVLMRVGR
jgi:two-component system chemotaxis response regulator CheB